MNLATAIDRFARQLGADGRSGHTRAACTRGSATLSRWFILSARREGFILSVRQVQLRFAALCREAGIDHSVSVHSLRHTFATRLYDRTGDVHRVQRALGHRQITTTEIYTRVSDDTLKRAIS